jgi:hypothetical protein
MSKPRAIGGDPTNPAVSGLLYVSKRDIGRASHDSWIAPKLWARPGELVH